MLKVLSSVRPKNLVIAAAAANVAADMGITAYITIGSNGKHMEGSKHYTGDALDLRSKHLEIPTKMIFLAKVLDRLGKGYEGFLEDRDTDNEHFHIEYDPK